MTTLTFLTGNQLLQKLRPYVLKLNWKERHFKAVGVTVLIYRQVSRSTTCKS